MKVSQTGASTPKGRRRHKTKKEAMDGGLCGTDAPSYTLMIQAADTGNAAFDFSP